ncbi:MAG TPA: C4-type zinc ribbon domain-containing protein [Acidobacteriota bacterium]|nr:C4-type zinc ribbon domain-containing protein [Acidobacteriota bacterium]
METTEQAQYLTNLVKLQNLLAQAQALRTQIETAPIEAEAQEQQLAEMQKQIDKVEQSLAQAHKRRRSLEAEIETLRTKLSHLKDQLMEVKTNTEYHAMQHEISYVQSRISEKEDEILEQMIAAEEIEQELAGRREELSRRKEEMESRRRELTAFLDSSDHLLQNLQEEIASLETSLPPDLLETFRRIATVRNGVALAPVVDQSCQACHVRLRPQLVAQLKTSQEILYCENCHRILYYSVSKSN